MKSAQVMLSGLTQFWGSKMANGSLAWPFWVGAANVDSIELARTATEAFPRAILELMGVNPHSNCRDQKSDEVTESTPMVAGGRQRVTQ